MQTVTLGKMGLQVSKLCFGTLTMSPLQKNLSPEEGAALLIYAYERGVRFLDTADLYGTYPHIRRALEVAPDYIVSSKAYCYDETTAREALERAFRGIGRDYVDIFLLHEQESLYTLRGHEEALNYLLKQKELGHVGYIGFSTHFVDAVRAAHRFPQVDVIHPLINYGGVGIQGGTREEMENAIRFEHDRGTGIYAMKALGGGHLIGKNTDALRYILEAGFIDSVAVGMQSFEEIDCNIEAFDSIEKASEKLKVLSRRERTVMVHDWCEACGKCVERCKQNAISIVNDRASVDMEKCVMCGYCASVCPQFCIKVV